ncbi:MAG: methyltransferase domain-containing protein [Nitrososphaerota archaeon]|nr:methyltransferase domain-containing protein [Nitrososphaerota archaeon]
MPYLLPRSLTENRNLAFIFAFGDLSYLEACTTLGERLLKIEQPWSEVALAEMKKDKGGYEKLVGIHKVAISITQETKSWSNLVTEVEDFLRELDDDFNFSVSLYGSELADEQEHESLATAVLATVRKAGFRKANMVRPRNGSEVLTKEIVSRKIIDFVFLRVRGGYWVGVTAYIPDTEQFRLRSNERPVVSADISMSSRLAKLLLNISGVEKGQTILDPFCGSGTILSEALLAGVNCIGVDRDRKRIENTKRNLEWTSRTLSAKSASYSLKVGDATRPETFEDSAKVDAVVTEPIFLPRITFAPSLERAQKLVRNSSRLYSESLYSITGIVKQGGRVVIVTPALTASSGKEVSVVLENLEEVGLVPFQPRVKHFDYPAKISHEKTRWVRRLVYVFEHR